MKTVTQKARLRQAIIEYIRCETKKATGGHSS